MKNIRKNVILLFAIVISIVVMTPLVSAANVDVNNIHLPQLQFDATQTKTIINAELSPFSGTDVYTIPNGSIIYHSSGGKTSVFDSTGKQILVADDNEAKVISTPNGPQPATHVHTVPSGSLITDKGNETFVLYKGQLLLTIEDNSRSSNSLSMEPTNTSSFSIINPMTSPFNGWIEYAFGQTTPSNPVTEFDAYWSVPKAPISRPGTLNNARTIFLFNGIRDPPNYNTIIQPVLEWNNKDTGYYWDIASWSLKGTSHFHSPRVTVNVNDAIEGTLTWDPGYQVWYVTTYKLNSPSSSTTLTTSWSPSPTASNLEEDISLEGWQIYNNNDAPGSTLFHDMIYHNLNGQNVPIVLQKYISPSAPLSGLGVEILSNPDKVKLDTINN